MKLIDTGPPLSPADLAAFEQEIDGHLPDDYKRFLLAANGGFTEPSMGLRWNGKVNEVPDFRMLLPTQEIGLRRALSNLQELGIDDFLPITSTQNEEDICLNFRDKIGAISLALYSRENDVAVSATMIPLADSFTEFLDSLIPIPVVYCPIEELGKNGAPDDLTAYLAEGNSIDAIGKNGLSILCEAIKFNNLPMIRACIEHGANLSQSVHIATGNKRRDLIKLLVDAGADVNEPDEYGFPPLEYVGGTALPGADGALNRELRDLLIGLGAVE